MITVIITKQAEKDIAGLDKNIRKRIYEALKLLQTDFNLVDIKKMTSKEKQWRIRVGDYRIRLTYDNGIATVFALRVLHRREAYRD